MTKQAKKPTAEHAAVVDTTEPTAQVAAIKPRIHDVVPYQDGDGDVYISKMAYSVLCQAEHIRMEMAENGERIFAANPAVTAVDVLVVDEKNTYQWAQPISKLGDVGVKVNKTFSDLEQTTHNKDIYQRFLID